jgi:hypothetical protein
MRAHVPQSLHGFLFRRSHAFWDALPGYVPAGCNTTATFVLTSHRVLQHLSFVLTAFYEKFENPRTVRGWPLNVSLPVPSPAMAGRRDGHDTHFA